MNWNHIEGNWKQLKGHVQHRWVKLTDEDLDVSEYSDGNTEHANKFGYDDISKDYSINGRFYTHGGKGKSEGSGGPGDGEGIPGGDESDEMDDSGKPIPNPMPDDLDEPAHAKDNETPHQEKSLDQT